MFENAGQNLQRTKYLAFFSLMLVITGVIVDRTTTTLGMLHPALYETNQKIIFLQLCGLWLLADYVCIALILLISFGMLEVSHEKIARITAYLPCWVFGIFRLLAGIHNYYLLLEVMA